MIAPSNAEYYTEQYWQNAIKDINPRLYKSQIFFENIGRTWVLPPGLKVQLGVVIGYTFDEMKRLWGEDQVLGIDLFNYRNDANVYCVDINKLVLSLPCAYIENDIGSSYYPECKRDRWAATKWGIRNLVPNGIMITNHGHIIGYPVEEYAEENNCTVIPMETFDDQPWADYLNRHTPYKTSGWCIIRKTNGN
jgi:hypothetical protein